MPKGPNGQKRPADAIGLAVMVGKIATGEVEETQSTGRRNSGIAGAKARAASLSDAERSKIAKAAAEARWKEKETVMTTSTSACDTVAAIYAEKRKAGLLDVKFLLQNRNEASYSQACEELVSFNKSKGEPLDFGDLSWNDSK